MEPIERENCEYNFLWTIENFSYCWQNITEGLGSPIFYTEAIQNTKWRLFIYPRGSCGSCIGYFLKREEDDGPLSVEIDSEVEYVSLDGLAFKKLFEVKQAFKKNEDFGYYEMQKRIHIVDNKDWFLNNDSLTVRCRLKKRYTNPFAVAELHARTIVNVERRRFVWDIANFSSLELDGKSPYVIRSTAEEILLTLNLFFSEDSIFVSISSPQLKVKYFGLKIFLTDESGNEMDGGGQQFFSDKLERGGTFPLLFSRQNVIKMKDKYLKNDVLSLNCKCAFTTGIAFEGIVKKEFDLCSLSRRNETVKQEYVEDRPVEQECVVDRAVKQEYVEDRAVKQEYVEDPEENPPSKKIKTDDKSTEFMDSQPDEKNEDVIIEVETSEKNHIPRPLVVTLLLPQRQCSINTQGPACGSSVDVSTSELGKSNDCSTNVSNDTSSVDTDLSTNASVKEENEDNPPTHSIPQLHNLQAVIVYKNNEEIEIGFIPEINLEEVPIVTEDQLLMGGR
ncbi:TD and POZ domain-containing protein 5 [Nephila pilipes]|uniref:TD and POZ domain-containing protein 5 n=1 Tax=Nephila pilipes TaxID=299642 RepID=A0A8X6QZR8_NEPPI|nr:TD and POZ domain-containing protein 5 [Nephila pilipes]